MKETRRQIIETTRNEMSRKYGSEIKSLRERLSKVSAELEEETRLRKEFEGKAQRLEKELTEYKEYGERLLRAMDLETPEERKEYLGKFQEYGSLSKVLGAYESMFNFIMK